MRRKREAKAAEGECAANGGCSTLPSTDGQRAYELDALGCYDKIELACAILVPQALSASLYVTDPPLVCYLPRHPPKGYYAHGALGGSQGGTNSAAYSPLSHLGRQNDKVSQYVSRTVIHT